MAGFSLSRSTRVQADVATVHALIVDPDLRRDDSGPDHGVGSTYHWSGNKKAGEGEMQIKESTPTSVVVDLEFLKPFKATNVTTFSLVPAGDATEVTWTMTGTRGALMSLLGKLFFDKAIGRDFEKGLAALKQSAEQA